MSLLYELCLLVCELISVFNGCRLFKGIPQNSCQGKNETFLPKLILYKNTIYTPKSKINILNFLFDFL